MHETTATPGYQYSGREDSPGFPLKPLPSITLFLGASGTGKTLMARALLRLFAEETHCPYFILAHERWNHVPDSVAFEQEVGQARTWISQTTSPGILFSDEWGSANIAERGALHLLIADALSHGHEVFLCVQASKSETETGSLQKYLHAIMGDAHVTIRCVLLDMAVRP